MTIEAREIPEPSDPMRLAEGLRNASHLTLLLDYDGTLVPFAPTPDLAAPDDDLRELLGRLAALPRTRVEIVSGRDRKTLGRWLGDLPIALRAEHGAWVRKTREKDWVMSVPIPEQLTVWAANRLQHVTARLGGWIEKKSAGAAWHYRGLSLEVGAVEDVGRELEAQLRPIGLEVLRGACVIEVRARGVDKGRAVQEALRAQPGATLAALGDDTTDEDMFRALPRTELGILVGGAERKTFASHRFTHVRDVRSFLASLVG